MGVKGLSISHIKAICRECPRDLKEAISSICFAAPRCSDLPELQKVQMLFAAKYGKEFVAAATELMPDCGVNRQIIELLSVRAPPVEAKLKLLKEIAEEHELDWDPAASETEFLKPHGDLMNGPNHFISSSTLPLPKEKHDDSLSPITMKESNEESDTDAGFDSLDLPAVPKVSVRESSDVPSPSEVPPQSAFPSYLEPDHEDTTSTPSNKDTPHIYSVEPEIDGSGPSVRYLYSTLLVSQLLPGKTNNLSHLFPPYHHLLFLCKVTHLLSFPRTQARHLWVRHQCPPFLHFFCCEAKQASSLPF